MFEYFRYFLVGCKWLLLVAASLSLVGTATKTQKSAFICTKIREHQLGKKSQQPMRILAHARNYTLHCSSSFKTTLLS